MRIPTAFRAITVGLIASQILVSCGSADVVGERSTTPDLDRSDLKAVAEASMTAFIEIDLETYKDFLLPEQYKELEAFESVMAIAPATGQDKPEVMSLAAVVTDRTDNNAHVTYTGEYCISTPDTEVPITAVGEPGVEPGETVPMSGTVVKGGRSCFDIGDISDFIGETGIEFRLVDGQWYTTIPL